MTRVSHRLPGRLLVALAAASIGVLATSLPALASSFAASATDAVDGTDHLRMGQVARSRQIQT